MPTISELCQKSKPKKLRPRHLKLLMHMKRRSIWALIWLSRRSSKMLKHAWALPKIRPLPTRKSAARSCNTLVPCSQWESTSKKWVCLNHCSKRQKAAKLSLLVRAVNKFLDSTMTPSNKSNTTEQKIITRYRRYDIDMKALSIHAHNQFSKP